jgi:hypothetical protein
VKWLYTGNFGLPAIPVTAEETEARAAWDYPWFGSKPTRYTPGKEPAEFTWVGGRKEIVDAEKVGFLRRYVQSELGEFKFDKKLIRKAMTDAMKARFGKAVASGHWRHPSTVPDLEITTVLDFGTPCWLLMPSDLPIGYWRSPPVVGLTRRGGTQEAEQTSEERAQEGEHPTRLSGRGLTVFRHCVRSKLRGGSAPLYLAPRSRTTSTRTRSTALATSPLITTCAGSLST